MVLAGGGAPQKTKIRCWRDVRHLAGTAMLAARLYAREATNQGGQMRVLLACAIIITTAVGLAGCFHHQQATYAEPIARPPLK